MRILILFLSLCVWLSLTANSYALNHKGLAFVEIRNAKTVLELTQIVNITDTGVQFVNLDDWGNETFQVSFDGKKMRLVSPGTDVQIANSPLQRALQLPLTQDEFLSILRFERPENFKACESEDGISWHKPKYKKLKILFEKFGTIAKTNLPLEFRIQYKKNLFHLKWLDTHQKTKSVL